MMMSIVVLQKYGKTYNFCEKILRCYTFTVDGGWTPGVGGPLAVPNVAPTKLGGAKVILSVLVSPTLVSPYV